ncbi:MAG: hypothetical protein P1P89_13895 [Desulfobacterales bacterium]|nr:hypothetical protein [Desulfobacterales bacterium]
MAINLERAALRGRLAECESAQMRLRNKFEALSRMLREGLNTALHREIEAIDIPQLATIWSDLEVSWGELLSIRSDIERLNRELGS